MFKLSLGYKIVTLELSKRKIKVTENDVSLMYMSPRFELIKKYKRILIRK